MHRITPYSILNDMIYTYNFRIGGLLIRVNSPFELIDLHELSSFRIEASPDEAPDALYSIDILPDNWHIRGRLLSQSDHSAVYEWQEERHHYFFWNVFSEELFVLLVRPKDHIMSNTMYLQKDTI